jgi:hypothetical protein
MNITDFYRIFNSIRTDYTFFSAVHENFSKTDHILGHKANTNKYKNMKLFPFFLLEHNGIKLRINSKENHKNYSIHED